jgi:DNA gyrase subunit A
MTKGDDEVLLGTRQGMAIRFKEEEARSVGRAARGVIGISLEDGDEVVGVEVVSPGAAALTVTERGYGKRTELEEYRLQGRGGKGIINIRTTERNGAVVGVMQVQPGDQIMMISHEGKITRLRVDEISLIGRATQGVRLQGLEPTDRVAAVTRLVSDEVGEEEAGGSDSSPASEPGAEPLDQP